MQTDGPDDYNKYIAELRASEERYHQIVDLSPDTIYIHRDGKILFMNQSGLKMFGATKPEQIIGQSIWMLYPPERHGIVRARNQMMEQTKQAAPLIEHIMVRLDGRLINVEAIARLITYEGKEAFYVIIRDITDRKRTNMYLEMQYSVAKILIEESTSIDSLNNVLKIICSNLNFETGNIWSLDKKDNMLQCVASYNNEHAKNRRDPKSGMAATILASSKPLWFDDLNAVFPNEFKSDNNFKIVVAIPISAGKQTVGFVELFSTRPHVQEKGMLDALFALSGQLGSYLKGKSIERELTFITKHNPITGLPNRSFFEELLEYKVTFAKNSQQHLALIIFAINSLNTINDAMGNTAVNLLLSQVAQRIERLTGGRDNVGNFRADEFGIILNVDNITAVTDFIASLNSMLAENFMIQEQHINITTNVGVALYPNDGEDAQALIRSVNVALTVAREFGRGAVQFCTPEMSSRARRRLNMEQELRAGLANNEFALNYQPIIDSGSRLIVGFESLLRWNHNGVVVSPGDFIPVAESSELIVPIGEWIISTACKQSKIWNTTSDHPICLSVNISPIQFKQQGLLDYIAKILAEINLEPKCLKVEVTESALMDDVQRSIKALSKIKELGVKVSIDDFGTGYSSLNYLRHLPVDYLKIDQSFVRNMTTNANDAAIVKTIVDLAYNLNYKIIVEGVETQQQLDFLNSLGSFEIQGYFFGRPMTDAEATDFLKLGKIL